MYEPKPIDTKDIALSPEMTRLMEQIAENVHDVWAARRIAEGWTYGPSRSDEAKTTPCLVPYEELPECEKEYDRAAAAETLKLILKMGYTISKE